MNSPKIPERLIPTLHHLARLRRRRMTAVVAEAIDEYVARQDLAPIAEKIGAEVRKQYLLGFTPSGQGELKYRLLVVNVLKRGNWDVRARRGYRGTAPVSAATH